MADSTIRTVPQVDIMLLGSPGVGKATFITRLPHVQHPSVTRRQQKTTSNPPSQPLQRGDQNADPTPTSDATSFPSPNDSQTTLIATRPPQDQQPPTNDSQTTLVPPSIHPPPPLTTPLSFNVLLFARPYRITIHASTSPLFIDPFPPSPHVLILTYAIPSRASLHNIQHYWMPQYHQHYPTSSIPTMLLGLQRDLRTARTTVDDATGNRQYECVMPEEGVQAARELRLDRYAECSALTGELMWEATQDLTKMAAMSVVDTGDYASEQCIVS